MKKLLENINIIFFFALILLLGGLAAFRGSEQLSDLIPDGDPSHGISGVITEHFPLRRSWNELYSRTSRVTGQKELFGIYYEQDGGRLIKLFSGSDSKYTESSVAAVNAFHRSRSAMPVYIMIVPTASGIYRGRLPLPSEAADQQKLIDDIYYNIDEAVIPLDIWGALYSARDDYIYFRTTDRWTPQGAYAAYAASISKLGFAPYTLQNYDVDYTNTEFRGSLAEITGNYDTEPDMINVYRCKYGSYIKSCTVLRTNGMIDSRSSVYSKNGLRLDDKFSYFLGTVHYKTARIKTTCEDAPRLLVIGSDYAGCFIPFLAPHYSEITLVNPFELGEGEKINQYVDLTQSDQTLILCDVSSFCGREGLDSITTKI